MIRTETTVKTLCASCGQELKDDIDFSLHRRKHHLEYCFEHYPHVMAMLKNAGFKDEPDDPALRKRLHGDKP